MYKLLPNANGTLGAKLEEKNVKDQLASLVEDFRAGRSQVFCSGMQTMFTKIALNVSDVMAYPKVGSGNSAQGTFYLCIDLLNNAPLYNKIRRSRINLVGNINKHQSTEREVDMKRCIDAYNELVDALSGRLGLTAVKKVRIDENMKVKSAPTAGASYQPNICRHTRYEPPKPLHHTPLHPMLQTSESMMYALDAKPRKAVTVDGNDKVEVSISYGDGIVCKKGIFGKKKYYLYADLFTSYIGDKRVKSFKVTVLGKSGKEYITDIKGDATRLEIGLEDCDIADIHLVATCILKVKFNVTKPMVCKLDTGF